MSLEKAIQHKKEHRKPYGKATGTYAKSVDTSCRNHGSCIWCMGNRLYSIKKRELAIRAELNTEEK